MADAAAPRQRRGAPGFLIFALGGFALLVGLGTWQIDRLHSKEASIADRTSTYALPPVELTGVTAADVAPWRRVTVSGTFLHDNEVLVGPRARRGMPGWHVVTPLRLEGGGIVVVDRGWTPEHLMEQALRPGGLATGRVTVEGVLKRPAPPGFFTPANQPAAGQWFTVDPAALARSWKLANVAPWWVEAAARAGDTTYPVGAAGLVLPGNNHLQYAITWYLLAAALAVIAVLRMRAQRHADSV